MASDFAVSPDGETLVFRWANELWSTSTAQGSGVKRLTNHPAVDSEPRFSPDGKRIAFVSNRSGSNQIYVMPAEGGIPEQKTYHSEGYSLADWFPDGNSVLAVANRDHFWRGSSRMIQIDITKRAAEKVLLDDAASNPTLSNDGKKILFVREGERWWRKGYRGERASQIWMLDLATGATSELLHEKVECLWPLWNGIRNVSHQNGTNWTKLQRLSKRNKSAPVDLQWGNLLPQLDVLDFLTFL